MATRATYLGNKLCSELLAPCPLGDGFSGHIIILRLKITPERNENTGSQPATCTPSQAQHRGPQQLFNPVLTHPNLYSLVG